MELRVFGIFDAIACVRARAFTFRRMWVPCLPFIAHRLLCVPPGFTSIAAIVQTGFTCCVSQNKER